jgi:hypothetical protein
MNEILNISSRPEFVQNYAHYFLNMPTIDTKTGYDLKMNKSDDRLQLGLFDNRKEWVINLTNGKLWIINKAVTVPFI